jgi:hypothetical protein
MTEETIGVGIPDRFTIDHEGGTFRIQRKWPRVMALPIAIFAVAWDSFLVSWYSGLLTQDTISSVMVLFPLPHVGVGVVLPYLALACLLNSTVIEVAQGVLTVRHRPLPFLGNRTLAAADIRQLFGAERYGRKGTVTYDVMARLASEREIKLVSYLSSEREARFIEQSLESYLGVADHAVSGELPR